MCTFKPKYGHRIAVSVSEFGRAFRSGHAQLPVLRKAAEIIRLGVRHSPQCGCSGDDRRFTVRVFCVTIDRVLTSLARYGPENKTDHLSRPTMQFAIAVRPSHFLHLFSPVNVCS